MIAETLRKFKDIETGVIREVGSRFEVSPERFAAINGTRYGDLVTEVVEVANEPEKPSEVAQEPSEVHPKPRRGRRKPVMEE